MQGSECKIFNFFKGGQFLKRANDIYLRKYLRPLSLIFDGDAITFACDIVMVPASTRVPNITNISSVKKQPNRSCLLIQ